MAKTALRSSARIVEFQVVQDGAVFVSAVTAIWPRTVMVVAVRLAVSQWSHGGRWFVRLFLEGRSLGHKDPNRRHSRVIAELSDQSPMVAKTAKYLEM